MTENTEEAVAWRRRGKDLTWEYMTTAGRIISVVATDPEPLFPLSSLETRDARIEKLEAALGKARVGINASYAMAQAEYQNHDRIAERHDCTVQDALEAIRQALTGEA